MAAPGPRVWTPSTTRYDERAPKGSSALPRPRPCAILCKARAAAANFELLPSRGIAWEGRQHFVRVAVGVMRQLVADGARRRAVHHRETRRCSARTSARGASSGRSGRGAAACSCNGVYAPITAGSPERDHGVTYWRPRASVDSGSMYARRDARAARPGAPLITVAPSSSRWRSRWNCSKLDRGGPRARRQRRRPEGCIGPGSGSAMSRWCPVPQRISSR